MNPHAFRHMILSHACLPIPALPQAKLKKRGEIISQTRRGVNVRETPSVGNISGIIRQVTEANVSRVINPESAGKERTQLSRAVVLALRELMRKSEVDEQTRDLAAFIYLALRSIYATIDSSVTAWEKRGYWLKADRFRMEWSWSESLSQALLKALQAEDWGGVALTAAQVFQKLKDVEVPQRHRLGEPWVGAWKQLESEKR